MNTLGIDCCWHDCDNFRATSNPYLCEDHASEQLPEYLQEWMRLGSTRVAFAQYTAMAYEFNAYSRRLSA